MDPTTDAGEVPSARQLLLEELRRRKERNPRYSLRAFAIHLGLSPGRLSHFISGQRQVSPAAMQKICDRLAITPALKSKLVAKSKRPRGFRSVTSRSDDEFYLLEENRPQESDSVYRIISEWEHFAILNLIKIRGQSHKPAELARRLGIPVERANLVIDRLVQTGMLLRERGRLVRTHERLRTTDGLDSQALLLAHKSVLERTIRSLMEDPMHLTNITSITMPIAVRKLPEANERLKAFRREMCEFLEGEDADEVDNLNLQLVPVTKVGGQK